MKEIVFCDIDGVLVDGQTQKLLLTYLFRRGKIPFGLFLHVYAWFILYKTGCVKDVLRIRQIALRAFQGWSQKDLDSMFHEFFSAEVRPRLKPAVIDFLTTKRAAGAEIVFLSATLRPIVERIASHISFGRIIATELEFSAGVCTGRIQGVVPYGGNKLQLALKWLGTEGSSWNGTWALGDHISDLSLLEKVEHPVVVAPDTKLKCIARERGWLLL